MCGLAGIFDIGGRRPVDEKLLRAMTTALRHRGPDGDGFHVEPGVGLGHRRLAHHRPRRPASSRCSTRTARSAVVFNGEIYDFARLRTGLESPGPRLPHPLRHRDDRPCLGKLGPGMPRPPLGMFAFALWDRNRGQLFLARDRLGKKPLYYSLLPTASSSSPPSCAACRPTRSVPRRLAPEAIEDYLAFGYIPEPGLDLSPACRNCRAAHYLLLERGQPMAAPQPYWRPHFADAADRRGRGRRRARSTRLRDCVGERAWSPTCRSARSCRAGSIRAPSSRLMAGLRTDPIATFTIGFDGESDETEYAAAMARRYRTAHHSERTADRLHRGGPRAGGDLRRALRRQLVDPDPSRLRAGPPRT